MPQYCINRNQQSNGDHEVHQNPCVYLPAPENQIDLGYHANCFAAVAHAKAQWPQSRINGCAYCSTACHTS